MLRQCSFVYVLLPGVGPSSRLDSVTLTTSSCQHLLTAESLFECRRLLDVTSASDSLGPLPASNITQAITILPSAISTGLAKKVSRKQFC